MSDPNVQARDEAARPPLNPPEGVQPIAPAAGMRMPSGRVSGLGQWAFDHKAAFSQENPLAWYGIRNVINNMVAILGLIATIVPVRMGMGKLSKWAMGKPGKGYDTFSKVMAFPYLQNALGVGVSFATFRTLYKMGQRAYDRVFTNSQSAEETSKQIADLPKNWAKDFFQLAPTEFPATMTAAFALVGIRSAITPKGFELKENHWKDVFGCALAAYPAFFEITEHLGRAFMLQRGYHDLSTNEHLNKDKQSPLVFLTRQIPGIAAGIVPYIHFNNISYRKTGRQQAFGNRAAPIDNFAHAAWKERPYEWFWAYTLGRDVYMDAYDAITGYNCHTGQFERKSGPDDVRRRQRSFVDHARPLPANDAFPLPANDVSDVTNEGRAFAGPLRAKSSA